MAKKLITSVPIWSTLVMLNLLVAYPLSLLRDLCVTFRTLSYFSLTLFSLCRVVDFKIWEYCEQHPASFCITGVQTQDKSFSSDGFFQSFFTLQREIHTELNFLLYAKTKSTLDCIYLICALGLMNSVLLPCCPQEPAFLVPSKAMSNTQVLYVILVSCTCFLPGIIGSRSFRCSFSVQVSRKQPGRIARTFKSLFLNKTKLLINYNKEVCSRGKAEH